MAPRTERLLGSVADGVYFAVLGLALAGVVAVARRRPGDDRDRRQGFLVLTMALAVVPPLLTFGDPRFKAPLYPLLSLYAALALLAALQAVAHPEEVEPPPRVDDVDPPGPEVGDPAPGGAPAEPTLSPTA
jgi:hypothetical protein